jgi:hypothetical protein
MSPDFEEKFTLAELLPDKLKNEEKAGKFRGILDKYINPERLKVPNLTIQKQRTQTSNPPDIQILSSSSENSSPNSTKINQFFFKFS